MFHWIRDHHRRKLIEAPFPAPWEEVLHRNVAHFSLLDESERAHLRALIQVLVAEKHWEGAGGLEMTDEIRVTISAHAATLLLGLPHNYYHNVESIIVYPSTVVPPQRKPGVFEIPLEPVSAEVPILGEAFLHGPVIVVWDGVLRGSRHPELGHNVVYHEFAHKLDMLDGTLDGTPPLRERAEYKAWVDICTHEYQRLRQDSAKGKRSFMDAYGATNEAEFFAVATEQFFDRPQDLVEQAPDLYKVLRDYYRQDPVTRLSR